MVRAIKAVSSVRVVDNSSSLGDSNIAGFQNRCSMQGQHSTSPALWGLAALLALMATQSDAGNLPLNWAALTSQTQLQGACLTVCSHRLGSICCAGSPLLPAVSLLSMLKLCCCRLAASGTAATMGPRCVLACIQAQEMGPAMELGRTTRAHAAMAVPQEGRTLTMHHGTMALT